MPALISWHLKSSSILLQASCTRARLRANLHSNLLAVYSQQNFLPLRGADQMAPCGAGNFFGGEARAQKWLEKCVRAESTQLVALDSKIKARCANAAGNTSARLARKKGPTQAGTQMTAWRLSANVRPCFWVSWNVYVCICEGVWVSRFEGFWRWVSWKFILDKIVCFDCRNSPFSLRGALPRTPLGASPQTPELAEP